MKRDESQIIIQKLVRSGKFTPEETEALEVAYACLARESFVVSQLRSVLNSNSAVAHSAFFDQLIMMYYKELQAPDVSEFERKVAKWMM